MMWTILLVTTPRETKHFLQLLNTCCCIQRSYHIRSWYTSMWHAVNSNSLVLSSNSIPLPQMIDDFGPTIKQKQKNIRKCFNTLHYSYQRILLGIMTNTNYWLVDVKTRVIHLKSKELQDTQQVVGSSNVLRIQLLLRVVQCTVILGCWTSTLSLSSWCVADSLRSLTPFDHPYLLLHWHFDLLLGELVHGV